MVSFGCLPIPSNRLDLNFSRWGWGMSWIHGSSLNGSTCGSEWWDLCQKQNTKGCAPGTDVQNKNAIDLENTHLISHTLTFAFSFPPLIPKKKPRVASKKSQFSRSILERCQTSSFGTTSSMVMPGCFFPGPRWLADIFPVKNHGRNHVKMP